VVDDSYRTFCFGRGGKGLFGGGPGQGGIAGMLCQWLDGECTAYQKSLFPDID